MKDVWSAESSLIDVRTVCKYLIIRSFAKAYLLVCESLSFGLQKLTF